MNELRKLVRTILLETIGFSTELKEITDQICNEIYDFVIKKEGLIRRQNYLNGDIAFTTDEKLLKTVPFANFIIKFKYNFDENYNEHQISGRIDTTKARKEHIYVNQEVIFVYQNIPMELSIKGNLNEEDLKEKLFYFFSHELHHMYQKHQKKIKNIGKSKSDALNSSIKSVITGDKYLQHFKYLVYLSLPTEIDARIHELYYHILKYKDQPDFDIVKEMKKHKMWKDAINLQNFDSNIILQNVSQDKIINFVNQFNREYKARLSTNASQNFKEYTDPEAFFKHWEKVFKSKSTKLEDKINRMITDFRKEHPKLFERYYHDNSPDLN